MSKVLDRIYIGFNGTDTIRDLIKRASYTYKNSLDEEIEDCKRNGPSNKEITIYAVTVTPVKKILVERQVVDLP